MRIARTSVAGRPIRAITIDTFADALLFCDRPAPVTVNDAKFSLQHAAAVVALKDRPDLADFEPAAIADPAIAALRSRVTLRRSPVFNALYPAHFGAAVHVALEDGSVVDAAVHDALGDPENPLPEADLIGKARILMRAGGLARADEDALIAAALALAEPFPAAKPAPLTHLMTLIAGIEGSTCRSGSETINLKTAAI
jgi:2-methylcitrate dehydratase PrpD